LHAAARELREETGFDAADFEFLTHGPGSAGASSEIVHFFLARDVWRAGEQSAQDKAHIQVHVIALASLSVWAKERESEGRWVDPKVWAGVFLAGEARARGALT
jgi:ADP-ribose pyrophosphatase